MSPEDRPGPHGVSVELGSETPTVDCATWSLVAQAADSGPERAKPWAAVLLVWKGVPGEEGSGCCGKLRDRKSVV